MDASLITIHGALLSGHIAMRHAHVTSIATAGHRPTKHWRFKVVGKTSINATALLGLSLSERSKHALVKPATITSCDANKAACSNMLNADNCERKGVLQGCNTFVLIGKGSKLTVWGRCGRLTSRNRIGRQRCVNGSRILLMLYVRVTPYLFA
jgi:hypothetical protein